MSEFWIFVIFALPLAGLLIGAIVEVVRRGDLTRSHKAAWLFALVFIPVFGLGFYIVVRPPRTEQMVGEADVSNAEAIVLLAERRQQGELTEAEFHGEIAAIASVD